MTIKWTLLVTAFLMIMSCDNQNNDVAEAYAENVVEEGGSEPITENAEEAISIDEFLLEFERAVENHDANTLMHMMDESYLAIQHQDYLEANTTQFIDEFFCGNVKDSDEYYCPRLIEINEIMPATDYEDNGGSYFIVYYISTDKETILLELTVLKNMKNGIISFGLIGAVG